MPFPRGKGLFHVFKFSNYRILKFSNQLIIHLHHKHIVLQFFDLLHTG